MIIIWRERGEGSFEIGYPRSKGWKNFRRRWTRGVGGLKNSTIFIDICVSSLDMKVGPPTKLGKRNMATSKKFYNDVMSAN